MTDSRMRCLIADDHPVLLIAVAQFLERSGFDVAAGVKDGPSAVAAAEKEQPDLAVVDYRMPRLARRELLRRLSEVAPRTRVVVYTAEADNGLVAEALAAGAAGVVLKEAPLADLARALEAVADGRVYIDPVLAGPALIAESATTLTARELDVLRLLSEGLTHEEIGQQLSISSETVRTHLRKACDRLRAKTRTQAVALALRSGLIN